MPPDLPIILLTIIVAIPWTQEINFASAPLLHGSITILTKETLNIVEALSRVIIRHLFVLLKSRRDASPLIWIKTSVVLDAYTSVYSHDADGELAELYFTKTKLILMAVSLAASVAMIMLLSTIALNTIVASTFGLIFIMSLFVYRSKFTPPIMALSRSARFI